MSKDEFDHMRALIKRFAETEMDQFALWRTETAYGPVYISITRVPEPGASDDAYGPSNGTLGGHSRTLIWNASRQLRSVDRPGCCG
jgi:hypothetical protein